MEDDSVKETQDTEVTVPKPQGGRPTIYTTELATEICKRLSLGESLRAICREEGMPYIGTVMDWVIADREGFATHYARARAAQAELMFDEILEIADDGSNDFMTIKKGDKEYEMENKEVTNRSRLRVDSRKWYLSKVLPKKFGDKLDLTSDGKALPTPIYGGTSVSGHNGDQEGLQPEKKD